MLYPTRHIIGHFGDDFTGNKNNNNNNNNLRLLQLRSNRASTVPTFVTQGSTVYRRVKPAKLLPHTAQPREHSPDGATDTHPITNRARRRVTSLIRLTPLPLRHAATKVG